MEAVLGKLLDVGGHGVRNAGGGGRWGQAQGETELAVEVSAPEGGVVTVGQAVGVAGLGEAVTQRAQEIGFADAGLAAQEHRAVGGQRCAQRVQEPLFGGREIEVLVGEILGEGGGISENGAR